LKLIAELEAILSEILKRGFSAKLSVSFLAMLWMMLASQTRLSPWANVMLNASILDLLRSV